MLPVELYNELLHRHVMVLISMMFLLDTVRLFIAGPVDLRGGMPILLARPLPARNFLPLVIIPQGNGIHTHLLHSCFNSLSQKPLIRSSLRAYWLLSSFKAFQSSPPVTSPRRSLDFQSCGIMASDPTGLA